MVGKRKSTPPEPNRPKRETRSNKEGLSFTQTKTKMSSHGKENEKINENPSQNKNASASTQSDAFFDLEKRRIIEPSEEWLKALGF